MSPIPDHGFVLFASDVERVALFYETLAGLTATLRQPGLIVLAGAGWELVVHALPPEYGTASLPPYPPPPREDSYIKCFFKVGSIADTRALAATLGGWVQPPEKEWGRDGFRACDGVDPEGNVVQFREPMG